MPPKDSKILERPVETLDDETRLVRTRQQILHALPDPPPAAPEEPIVAEVQLVQVMGYDRPHRIGDDAIHVPLERRSSGRRSRCGGGTPRNPSRAAAFPGASPGAPCGAPCRASHGRGKVPCPSADTTIAGGPSASYPHPLRPVPTTDTRKPHSRTPGEPISTSYQCASGWTFFAVTSNLMPSTFSTRTKFSKTSSTTTFSRQKFRAG